MLYVPDGQATAGLVAAGAIQLGKELCETMTHGLDLDKEIETYIRDHGCTPALKGYHPPFSDVAYKHTICLCINNEAVHGVPDKVVSPNDLITIDLVVECDGWFADTARTFTYDKIKDTFAKNAFFIFRAATSSIMPNGLISKVGDMVDIGCKMAEYCSIEEYCGHGIGRQIHETPYVLGYSNALNVKFEPGRAYAVEPIICSRDSYYLVDHEDRWTVSAFSNRSEYMLVAHNEDTIFISENEVLNLTACDD